MPWNSTILQGSSPRCADLTRVLLQVCFLPRFPELFLASNHARHYVLARGLSCVVPDAVFRCFELEILRERLPERLGIYQVFL